MSVFTKARLTDKTVVIPPESLKIPDAGSVQTFMFTAVQGQLKEPCVVKVNTALAKEETKKITEKRAENLQHNLLIMAQLYRVAAKRLCQLRCLNAAEVDKLKEAVTKSGALTTEQKSDLNERYEARKDSPQVWYLMEKLEDLVEFDTHRILQRKKQRGDLDQDEWLSAWQTSAQKALRKKGVWEDLGSIATVDMFVGNTDRLDPFAMHGAPKDPEVHDMAVINPGNVIIGKEGPVGLDFFDCLIVKNWDLYHEYKPLDKNWPGYFLTEKIPEAANEARRVRKKSLAARKEEFSTRVVKELMRICKLKDDPIKPRDRFIYGMGRAEGDIQFWVRKTAKKFCKDIGAPVPPGLAQRDQLIWGA